MPYFSKTNIILLFALIILLFVVKSDNASGKSAEKGKGISEVKIKYYPVTPTPDIPVPQSLVIPKIGAQAQIIEVGVDGIGKMELPEGFSTVGWYSLGFKPGQPGNAAIAGHYDQPSGTPAIFYNLHKLVEGDEVQVSDEKGNSRTFVVIRTTRYEFDQAPMDEIFGKSDDKMLNLITCAGWWNMATHNYSHRLVVYTRLKE